MILVVFYNDDQYDPAQTRDAISYWSEDEDNLQEAVSQADNYLTKWGGPGSHVAVVRVSLNDPVPYKTEEVLWEREIE